MNRFRSNYGSHKHHKNKSGNDSFKSISLTTVSRHRWAAPTKSSSSNWRCQHTQVDLYIGHKQLCVCECTLIII